MTSGVLHQTAAHLRMPTIQQTMHTKSPTRWPIALHSARAAGTFFLGLILAATTFSAHGQGEIASGTLSSSGSGPFSYSLTFSDAAGATAPIGSIWYSWTATTPPFFYLPGTPSSASAPAGWTASIQSSSIQFTANSPANDIQPGNSLSGFGFQATFTPAQVASAAHSGLSVAYSGGIEAPPDSAGYTFTVAAVPEPGSLALMLAGAGAWAVSRRRR